ncbi:MAG: TRAP transporter large permease subunit, partial [Microbacteriaceae bacterium]
TGESIGRMLLAGIIPGIITMACYSIGIVILYKRGYFEAKTEKDRRVIARFQAAVENVKGGEATLSTDIETDSGQQIGALKTKVAAPRKDGYTKLELSNITGTGYVVLLFAIVIGGMYSGIFTATEAGAIAAAAALVILGIRKFKTGFSNTMSLIKESLIETASVTSMIFALLFGGAIFAFFLIKTNIPGTIARTIIENDLPPMLIVIISLVLMVILGMFLDSYSIMVIVVPLIYPIISALGVNGIWFGILTVKAMEIGLLTPPVGVNVFVASGISKDVTAAGIFKAITPMYLTEVAVIIILIVFPDLVTIIPDLAFAK